MLTCSSVLELGDPTVGDLERRQSGPPTQHNISQVVTPSTTGRWTASIEAQLQSSQQDLAVLRCTLSICAGQNMCGAAKSISASWSTFSLKIQLRAREPQTISFVTSCTTPAYVAIRNPVIPGQNAAGMNATASTLTRTIELPASTVVSTAVALATGNSTFGSAESIALINHCEHSWITIFGDNDFEHIPPRGMAIVPVQPSERFGAGCRLQTLAEYTQYCASSVRDGQLGCATGILWKRDVYHPTHPRYLNDKDMAFSDFDFVANDVVSLDCTWERHRDSYDQQASVSIASSGCGAVTLSGIVRAVLYQEFSLNMAFDGNTANDISLPYPSSLLLQPWSRGDSDWMGEVYASVDGAPLDYQAWIEYELEDEGPHTFEFVCNYTKQDPPLVMRQVVYSATTTTETTTSTDITTDTQWSTSTETQWSTTTDTFTSTSTETRYDTETQFQTETLYETETEYATSTCDASIPTEEPSTSSEFSMESTTSATPSPPPPPPPPVCSPQPPSNIRGTYQVNLRNRCYLRTGFPVIFSQPQISIDSMAFTQHDSSGISLLPEDMNPTFYPVAGGRICVKSQQTGEEWCGDGPSPVTARPTRQLEDLDIDCPGPRPGSPDLANTIPLNIRVGSACAFFAVQIGCEEGQYCLGQGFENIWPPRPNAFLQYPVLPQAARLRVRVTDTARNEWRVQFVNSDSSLGSFADYSQCQGNWLDISVPSDARGINLEMACYSY